jgi:hypothetical protein
MEIEANRITFLKIEENFSKSRIITLFLRVYTLPEELPFYRNIGLSCFLKKNKGKSKKLFGL